MVRAAIVSGLTREQRQRLRRTLGRLETNLVRKSTLDRYARTFNEFSEYMQQIYTAWPTSAPEFDKVVSEYLEVLWDAGETKSSAAYTLASIHYFLPQLKHQLPRSWKLKAIWDKLELPCQAVPLNPTTLFALVGYFHKKQDQAMGLACILGFNAMLRTGELLDLRVENCHFTPSGAILHLQNTKGGQRRLIQEETVIIEDHLTLWALGQLCTNKCPGDFLVGISPSVFRTRWNQMKQHLNIARYRYLPYSLRRGGATWFFHHTGSFSLTMVRGRWQHLKTCKLYLSEAQTALTSLSLPPSVLREIHRLHDYIRPHLFRWAKQGRVNG